MNRIVLNGVMTNVQFSHNIGDVEFDKAEMIVKRETGQEDLINIKFKKFSNPYQNGQEVALVGNLRSFNESVDGKDRVNQYVFTYFDSPEDSESDVVNHVEIDGRICKIGELTVLNNGKHIIRFIIANSISKGSSKLTSYIHCVGFGVTAKKIAQFKLTDFVKVTGQFHSRTYKKFIDGDNFELRIAHEVFVKDIEPVSDNVTTVQLPIG